MESPKEQKLKAKTWL